MKKLFIIILILFSIPLYSLSGQIKNNYFGIDLIYNSVTLIDTEEAGNGYGFDLYYQSFISDSFSYKVLLGFLYNSFTYDKSEQIYNPLLGEYQTLLYTKNEDFYNLSWAFLFNYNIFSGDLSPYLSSGLVYSFIYKNLDYSYKSAPIDFISTQEKGRWLPATLGFPIGAGCNLKIGKKSVINFEFTYIILFFDPTSENYGYKDLMNIKLGYMHATGFKM
ncbi:MAG: hypothetical protein KKH98_09265 [Spirochaetes bacterium]|nr:hypothetical protein [Spirochaetota bacterium]